MNSTPPPAARPTGAPLGPLRPNTCDCRALVRAAGWGSTLRAHTNLIKPHRVVRAHRYEGVVEKSCEEELYELAEKDTKAESWVHIFGNKAIVYTTQSGQHAVIVAQMYVSSPCTPG